MLRMLRCWKIALIGTAVLLSCKQYPRNKTHADIPIENVKEGEKMAAKYCQSCHALPDPALLDAKSWENGVLPNMGPRLGIFQHSFHYYPSNKFDRSLGPDYYPSKPVMGDEDWQRILDYYTATAPDSLPKQQRKYAIKDGLPLFNVLYPSGNFNNAATCYVKINEADAARPIVISDALKKAVYLFDNKMTLADSIPNTGAVVDINYSGNNWLACNIGVLNPNNGKFGKGENINMIQGHPQLDTIPVFDSLQRPVQLAVADLNNDGKADYVVCEFGFLTGALSWMENKGSNKFVRHVIRPVPGAIKAYVQDYNHDGLPDLWVLFAQGDEGIFLFTNKGNGLFEEERVLRFPPVYGSSYFELADFNKDGFPDIVYTCGDNADYSPVLKPYHGVYIFMNDGKNQFTQQYFFPINGCYKAIARDFDGDGDLDIATISFFADYGHQPEEGFVYLKNEGDFDFHPYTLPQGQLGRWLTMDAGSINKDGTTDLILGNFCIGPKMSTNKYDWKKSPPFIVLKNTGKRN